MQTAEQRAAAIEHRDARIIEGIKAGWSVKEIAVRVGVEEDYAKKLRVKLAREHGLTITSGSTPDMPYGLTDRTLVMRGRLNLRLANLVDQKGMHPVEVACRTGVTQTEQTQNRVRPWPHDWKLSELERLAEAEGVDVMQLLQEVLKPRMNGEAL